MPQTQSPLPCAWCIDERATARDEHTSHGICAEHAQQVYDDYVEKRVKQLLDQFDHIPSYVERFKDGREEQ